MAPKAKRARSALSGVCTSKEDVREEVLFGLNHYLGGSGDLEQEDAKDVVDFFSEELASEQARAMFKQQMMNIEIWLRAQDVNWQPAEVLERIPPPDSVTTLCMLGPWQLGFGAEHSLKGKLNRKWRQLPILLLDLLKMHSTVLCSLYKS